MKLLAVLLFLFSIPAFAEDMSCEVNSAKNEPKPATMLAKCDGYNSAGYIDNEQRVSTVSLVVTGADGKQSFVTIPGPAQGIRAYYEPFSNEVVRGEIEKRIKRKIADSDSANLVSFTADPQIKLFKESGFDWGTLENVPVLGKNDSISEGLAGNCVWAKTPQRAFLPTCGGMGAQYMCFGRIKCGEAYTNALCGKDGAKDFDQNTDCSKISAYSCAIDKTIDIAPNKKPAQASGDSGTDPQTQVPAN